MWEDDGDVVNPAGDKGGKPKAKAKGKAAAKPQTQPANPQDENMDDGSGTGSGSESGSEDEVQEDDQGGGDDHGKKKCTGFCNRKKQLTKFLAKQCVCIECRNVEKAVQTRVKAQNQTEWWEALNSKERNKVYKGYAAKKKTEYRPKFDLVQFKAKAFRRSGTKFKKSRKMMWRDEFYEWAGKPKGGSMCDKEKEVAWKWYLETEGIRRDDRGPRGQKRCSVFIGDFVDDYEDAGQEDSIDVSGKSQMFKRKNMSM